MSNIKKEIMLLEVQNLFRGWTDRLKYLDKDLRDNKATPSKVAKELYDIGMDVARFKKDFSCESDLSAEDHDQVMQMAIDLCIKCFETSSELCRIKKKYGTEI